LQKATENKDGLWLEVFCPDESCLLPEEAPVNIEKGEAPDGSSGDWLKIFCPGGSCEGKVP
jgi:hypothetical protein